jgi:glycosyltransferase involved in cell wall biosynthesis
MKRIVFYAYSMEGGGAEKVCQMLANRFSEEAGYKVYLILIEKKGSYLKYLNNNVKIISISSFFSVFKIFNLIMLAFYLKKTRADCLVSFAEWPNFYAGIYDFFKKNKIKKIYCEQNTKSFINDYRIYGVSSLVNRLSIISYNRADQIVCSSYKVYQTVKSSININSISVIYNPVDCLLAKELGGKPIPIDLNPFALNFVAIGRFHPQKDYKTMLLAFDKAYKVNKNIELFILGDGEQRSFIVQIIDGLKSKDSIHLMGFQDNPFSFLSKADALIHSALFEGFGNIFVESLSVGTPIITTDCGTPREIILDPLQGVIVPVSDIAALAKAILKQPKKNSQISDSCIVRSQFFDVESCFVKYKSVIEQ